MRVLTFTTVFPNPLQPEHGIFVLERIRHCAEFANIRVVAPRPFYPWPAMSAVPRRETRAGIAVEHPTFRYVPRFAKWSDGVALFLSSVGVVASLMREAPFDVIDAHFGYPEGFAAVLLGRRFRRPVVITLRGNEPLLAADPGRRRALRYALRNATRIIAVSEPLAQFAREALADLPGPVPPVTVIANGVDATRFAPEPREEARRVLGLPDAGRLLVSVGHLSPRKGFHRVLRVLPDLLRDAPDLTFAIVGGRGAEANNERELHRLAADPALAGRVIFAGAQRPERVRTWLSAADLFVLASDFEGCPNVVWEALACGRPVVAAKVGEVERMVPTYAGELFDDADDLPALRAALAAGLAGKYDANAIRGWAERHGWGGVAMKVVEEWRAAVQASAPAVAQREYAA